MKFLLYNLVGGLIMLAAVIGLYVVTAELAPALLASGDRRGPGQRLAGHGDQHRALAVPRLLLRLRGEGAAVAAAHLAAQRRWARPPPPVAVLITAVVDKVGTFAMLRFCLQLFPEASKWATPVILVLALISIIYGALLAVGQRDIKRLIAYASISHFGFIILGIFAMTSQGQSRRHALHGQPRHLDRRADAGGRLPDHPARLAAHRATTAACRRSPRCSPAPS